MDIGNADVFIDLLRQLVATPSLSGEEGATAELLADFLLRRGVRAGDLHRYGHNVWAYNRTFDPAKPTILLNSHHDTVRPGSTWTRDPFDPAIEGAGLQRRLYGLGSNDAGASVVSLAAAFLHFYHAHGLSHNLCLALTAEEETSGTGGLESVLPKLGELAFALVGEPTGMQLAIAERGLVVLDCVAHGRAGHAAREEGENAIYNALRDIEWLRTYQFEQPSELFGNVKMSVTMISAGSQHNVVPHECRFTVDVRVTERYTNEQVLAIIREHLGAQVSARSLRLRSSSIDPMHPIVQAGLRLGRKTYGSPTSSDQALLNVPSLKMGPGDSARSHTADEYIWLSEIEGGIELYVTMLAQVLGLGLGQ